MPTLPPPAAVEDAPRKRRIVPPAHLLLEISPANSSTLEPSPPLAAASKTKGDVARLIRSMPNAPPPHVVATAKEQGIVTTLAYVRWLRWADRTKRERAKPAPSRPAKRDLAPPAVAPAAKAPEEKRPRPEAATPKKAPRAKTAAPTSDEAAFRRAVGVFLVEGGVARVRAVVDEIEAMLLDLAMS